MSDIEHQFCQPSHIATALGIASDDAAKIVDGIISANGASLAAEFANKRTDLKSKALRSKESVPSAADLISAQIDFKFIRGKRLFGLLDAELVRLKHNPLKLVSVSSEALKIADLQSFAHSVWSEPIA